MSNPTVREMVEKALKEGSYDGVFCPGICSCRVDDLAPCSGEAWECEAGYLAPCPEDCDCGCGGPEAWHIQREKPEEPPCAK